MRLIARFALTISLTILSFQLGSAADWPQFRGPGQDGIADQKGLPDMWGADQNIAWKTSIPGRGWSSPVVWGDKVFVTASVLRESDGGEIENGHAHNNGDYKPSLSDVFSWQVSCLDRDSGEILWTRVAAEGHPRTSRHQGNTYATETPVTDGERIYAYFGMMGVYCYDFEGHLVWSNDLGAFPMYNEFGTASSPCFYDGRLFLQVDNEEKSFLVSLNAKTGEEIWRIARDESSNWSNPMIWQNKVRTELITQGKMARSYDPISGKLLWEFDVKGGRNSCTPVGDANRLYLANEKKGGGGFLFAVNAGASGDITLADGEDSNADIAWYAPNAGIAMASPLLYQGYIYALDRRTGLVSCFEAESGDTAYFKTRLPDGKAFWASPWAADGKVFCLDEAGTTHVLAAGSEFDLITQNKIEEKFWASAALAPESVILRGSGHVYCIRNES